MRAVWVGALALTALFCAALYARYAPPEPELAFVGSSIINSAIPWASPLGGLLGDGRGHEVVAIGGASERQTSELVGVAIDRGFRGIFVEINPFVRTNADRVGRDTDPPPAFLGPARIEGIVALWEDKFDRFGKGLRLAIRALASAAGLPAPQNPLAGTFGIGDQTYDGNQRGFDGAYPLEIHQPSAPELLDAMLAKARASGVMVAFLVPPGPQAVWDYLGPPAEQELASAISVFERRFGVVVWSPSLSWPDGFFADRGHLNERGRKRFVEALRVRFGTQNDRD